MNTDARDLSDQGIGERLPEQGAKQALLSASDNDLGDVFAACQLENLVDEIGTNDTARFRSKALGKLEKKVQLLRGACRHGCAVGALDGDDKPWCVEPRGQPRGGSYHFFRQGLRSHADEQSLCRVPRSFDGILLEVVDHLVVDPVGGAAQRQFAQRR